MDRNLELVSGEIRDLISRVALLEQAAKVTDDKLSKLEMAAKVTDDKLSKLEKVATAIRPGKNLRVHPLFLSKL